MIELFEDTLQDYTNQSSKGNQLKWHADGWWYKADHAGYEGLTEYVISQLLAASSLKKDEYILYSTEQISYRHQIYQGCRSRNFLKPGEQLITLERLFAQQYQRSLYKSIFQIQGIEDRAVFLTRQVEQMTGIQDFGIYLSKLLTIDAFFLNEDRHMHNIAVILDDTGKYRPAPVFDQGAGLLSDIHMDYPLGENVYDLIDSVHAKTLDTDFDEQVDAVEKLYGEQIHFHFNKRDVERILASEPYYSDEIKNRVRDIIFDRMRKYGYLCG